MSQSADPPVSSPNSRQSEFQSLDGNQFSKASIEDRKRARRLSIDNRELLIAISENNFENVERLVNGEIDINFKDRDGNTPLHWAIETQNLDIIQLILRKKEYVECETNKAFNNYVKTLNRPDILQIFDNSLNIKLQTEDEKVVEKRLECINADDVECRKDGQAKHKKKDEIDCEMTDPVNSKLTDEAQCKDIDRVKSDKIGEVHNKGTNQAQYKKADHVKSEKLAEALNQLNQSITTFRKFDQVQFGPQTKPQTNEKKQVTAIHGYIYQLKLLMLFLYRGVSRQYSFRLGTEIVEAKKFDDLVFEYIQDGKKVYRLLQAKHKQDESKKITAHNLLTEKNGDYNLIKYFLSYRNSKNEKLFKDGSIKDVTICTNIDWDYEDLKSNGINIEKIENEDDVLDVKFIQKQSSRFKFDKTVVTLLKPKLEDYSATVSAKESIKYTNNEVKDFLRHLVFAVNQPNEEELGRIVEYEMGREFGFITTENVYNKLFVKMLDWLKNKNMDRFLSYKEGKEFFEEARTGIPIWFNIKSPTHTFVGRVKQLNDLHRMLQDENKKERQQFISISGLGGVGKSELVKQYVNQYSRQYDNKIIWINAESYRTLAESFHTLARDKLRISTINADNKEKETRSIVEDVYKYLSEGKCLFIFDNAEKYKSDNEFDHGIANFLPSLPPGYNRPYILITSRNKKWPENVHVLELDVFNEDEATEFVKKSLNVQNEIQEHDIDELVRQLHCLPLALQQAVAYIKVQDQKLKNIGKLFNISDYLKKFMEKAADVLNFNFSESTSNDYTKTIFTTWNVTLDVIKKKKCGGNALKILYVASYLAPEDIPTVMFSGIAKDNGKIASAIELLKQYSMVNLEHAGVNVHRIVQHVIRIKLKKQKMEEEVLTKVLESFYVHGVNSDTINHATSFWTHANKYSTLALGSLSLLNMIAHALANSSRYDEAYSVLEKILQFVSTIKTNFMIHPLSELATKNNMGLICIQQGKYSMAYDIFQEVLARQELMSGAHSSEAMTVKSNVALALFHQGEYTKALKYYEELYDMEVRSGSEQLGVMRAKCNIATIFLKQGKLNKALSMLQEVYNLEERVLGIHHPTTLETRSKIACVLVEQSKFEEALKMLREIHNAKKFVLKTNNRSCAIAMGNIASTLFKQGKYNAALKIFQEVLHAEKDVLGEDHPVILATRSHIAEALRELGKFDEALTICQDTIHKQKRVLRPDHPDILHTLRAKAHILGSQGRCSSALKLYQEILEKQISATGADHPDTLTVRNIIAHLYLSEGNYDQALATCRNVFRLQGNLIGEDHLDTLYTKNNIGMALYHKKEYDSALHIFQEIYDKFQALYPDHPCKYMSLHNIGLVLASRRQYPEALKLYKEVLDFQEVYFGKDHPDTTTTKNNIVVILLEQGRYKESFELLHDVFKGINKVFGPNNRQTMHVRNRIKTVLLHAIDHNDVEEVKHFFERDANITVANFDSMALLHHTVNKNKADILNVLLRNGGDPTLICEGKTALHVAANKNCIEIVNVLLRYVSVDKLRNFINAETIATRSTALHIAAKYGHSEIVKVLLKRGAIYNLENLNRKTPLSLSREHGVTNLLKLIEELFEHAKNGNAKLIDKLRAMQYDVFKAVTNARNNGNNTVLQIIKANNHKDIETKYMEILTSI